MKVIDYNLLLSLIEELNKNSKITQKELMKKYEVSERTIRRYLKILKDENLLILEAKGKNRNWKIKT